MLAYDTPVMTPGWLFVTGHFFAPAVLADEVLSVAAAQSAMDAAHACEREAAALQIQVRKRAQCY
jgi:hypothetical protein